MDITPYRNTGNDDMSRAESIFHGVCTALAVSSGGISALILHMTGIITF